MPLIEYINLHFSGNRAAFARHMGKNRQQITKWLNDGWIVVGDKLYSPRQDIPQQPDIIEATQ